jgi:glycosyltransferase involved in cell wall biosynthesis
MALVSIVIPVFNERLHIVEVLARVTSLALDKEIIVVDDFSTDGTRTILKQLDTDGPGALGLPCSSAAEAGPRSRYRVVLHARNRGKGAALRTGFEHVTGDVVCIQDADLEYDPMDLPTLIAAVRLGQTDCAFGSRFLGRRESGGYFVNRVANWVLTQMSNLTTGYQLTDMETCYKVFRSDILRSIQVEEDRFGFEPEVTAKLAVRRARVQEFPISYAARSHSEGKKIGLKDGLRAIYCILKYGLFRRRRVASDPASEIGAAPPPAEQ